MNKLAFLWVACLALGCASEGNGAAGSGGAGIGAADASGADASQDTVGQDAQGQDGQGQDAQGQDTAGLGPVLHLQPGQMAELTVSDGTTGARLATTGSERFVVVLASTQFDKPNTGYAYSLDLAGGPTSTVGALVTGCSLPSAPWKDLPLTADPTPTGPAPVQGSKRTLKISTKSGTEAITVEAKAVGQHAVVWVDVTPAHPASIDAPVIADFLEDFETVILPRGRAIFGMESDQDKDGRVHLVFTPLTKDVAVAFFTGCDLQALPGCPEGNGGEYLYMTPPSALAPPYNTPSAIEETLAHEFAHLLHFHRKVLRNQLPDWEDSSYLIEGLGALAQDVFGYQAGNLYVAKAGLEKIDDFSLGQTLKDFQVYDLKRDGALRGGSYWFARWLYDRAGGDQALADGTVVSQGGPALLRALLDAKVSFAKALPTVTGAAPADLAMDFYATLAMSNREDAGGVAATNPCLRLGPVVPDPVTGKPRGGSVFAKFHGQGMKGPFVQASDQFDGKLRAGGVEYLVLDAVAGQPELAFTLQADAPAKVRVRVGRWK